jgi:PAS domain S-box-containing protein
LKRIGKKLWGINIYLSILILTAFFHGNGLWGKAITPRFQHYTVEEGLAQNSVFSIIQDGKGFLWIGTEQGINRFDGYDFRVFNFQFDLPNTLSNSYILSICEDSRGILWLGTNGGGLNRLDPEKEIFSHFFVNDQSHDSLENVVRVVYEDRSRRLWLGTPNGLKEFNRESGTFIHFQEPQDSASDISRQSVTAIFEDYTGTLWIGTEGGIRQFDPVSKRFKTIQMPPSHSHSPAMQERKIYTIYEDHANILWLGTSCGFFRYERSTGTFTSFMIPCDKLNKTAANIVISIYEDRFGVFWIGTNYGLYIYNRQNNTYQSFVKDPNNAFALNDNTINTIYEDRSGALWFGTYGGGLNKLNRTGQSFKDNLGLPQGLDTQHPPVVFAMLSDKENKLWIGTYGDGLNVIDRETGGIKNYRNQPENSNSLSNDNIWSLCKDDNGFLWIGTEGGGLNRFHPGTETFTHYRHHPRESNSLSNDTISSIVQDRSGYIWIGTNFGLNRFHRETESFTHYKTDPNHPNTLVHNNVYIIFEDKSGLLWIGTKGGLNCLDPKTGVFTSYPINPGSKKSIVYAPVFSIYEDRKGMIWIGTTGGLFKHNPKTKNFQVLLTKDGLPSDVINGILEDSQGNLWFSTNKGLSKLNPTTGTFQNYSKADGLQNYEFCGGSYFKSHKGELFFGGINGYNAFFPENIKDNPFVPPVLITDFKLFNQNVPIGEVVKGRVILDKNISSTKRITLSNKHNNFSLEYAGLNYIHSENNEYAYMMEGLENSWNYAGRRRFVTYTNLGPGQYVFKVKASNNNGVWNETGTSLKIKILPPFWSTWWFRFVLILIFVVILFAYHTVSTRTRARRKQEVEDIVARRTTALTESGEKYRAVVETTNHGVAIVQEYKLLFQNAHLANMLGVSEEEMTNRPLIDFIAPEKRATFTEFWMKHKEHNEDSGIVETTLLHRKGKHIPVEIDYSHIRYKKGIAHLMFFHNVGMKKMLEEERMKIAKLESSRTLARGIAHDFNNLLAIIVANIDMALDEAENGTPVHNMLSQANKAVMRSVDLTRKFITLAQGGDPVKKPEPIIDHIRDMVLPVLSDSQISCDFIIPDDLWMVDCDIRYIKQAVNNIVVNAKQAMSGIGNLIVMGENVFVENDQVAHLVAGKYVRLSFKDSGHGIAEEDLPKIFDPYFSTRENVTQKGLGLGLSVVHSIISRHGGTIRVNSQPENGTTVDIYLPTPSTPSTQG